MWRMTFESLLITDVLIILTWLLKLRGVMKNFIGINTEKICSFLRKGTENLRGICKTGYLWISGLSWLNFGLRELPICTKICTKASSLMLLWFFFSSALVS